jgi:hypothetical protein
MLKKALFTYVFLGKRRRGRRAMTKLTPGLKLLTRGYSGHRKSGLPGGRQAYIYT